MDVEEIIAKIGSEKYRETCAQAWRAASTTGDRLTSKSFTSDIPHEISNLIWDSALPDTEKVALTFRVYADMPCYGLLMYVDLPYNDLSPLAQDLFWTNARALLSQDEEALSSPMEYALWCDYFECMDRVERAWAELLQETLNDRLLRRILIASGPVPFALKTRLYEQLIGDKQWHYYIFRSLLHSSFDVYGHVDATNARSILQSLDLPPETEHLTLLSDKLADLQSGRT